MRFKFISLLVSVVMVLSAFAIVTNYDQGASGSGLLYISEGVPIGTYHGNITIYPNDTLSSGASAAVHLYSGTATLVENINGTIFDKLNNSIIDGSGLTVNALGQLGISLAGVSGVVIESTSIINASTGVCVSESNNIEVSTVSFSDSSGNTAIYTSVTTGMNVTNIKVTGYYYGLDSYRTSDLNLGGSYFNKTTYGVCIDYGNAVNLENNYFNSTSFCAIRSYYAHGVTISGNVVMHTGRDGVYVYENSGINVSNNLVTYADYAIYIDSSENILSSNNTIQDSTYGIYLYSDTNFTSMHDMASQANEYPLYFSCVNSGIITYGNFANATDHSYICESSGIQISHSNFSHASVDGLYLYYNIYNVNLSYDSFNMSGTSGNGLVLCYDNVVSLYHDQINTTNGYGILTYKTVELNMRDSVINSTSYDILSCAYDRTEGGSVSLAMNNDSFVSASGEYAIYVYEYLHVDSIVLTNSTFKSSGSGALGYGVLTCYSDSINSVIVNNNRFYNVSHPVYLYCPSTNVVIDGNIFHNPTCAVYSYGASSITFAGNTIYSVTDYGIYTVQAGFEAVSNNTFKQVGVTTSSGKAIYLEHDSTGTIIVSGNFISFNGSTGTTCGITIYEDTGSSVVYGNMIYGTSYPVNICYSTNVHVFGNTIFNASDTGFCSNENNNFSYYGNTITNAKCGLSSSYDTNGLIYGNTFTMSQANESGLCMLDVSDGTSLTFYHNNFINDTTNSTVKNYVASGQFGVEFNSTLPVGGNYWSNYTGTGSNGIGTAPMPVYGSYKDYYPLTSMWTSPTETFVETGLPAGTLWSVTLGTATMKGTGDSIVFQPSNAEHITASFSVARISGYNSSMVSGMLNLNASNSVVTLTFTKYTYAVSFTQSTLPSGTTWSVTLNGNTKSSSTGSITFSEPNGTYSYSIGSVTGYHTATASGNFNVSDAGLSTTVSFSQNTYTVTVMEIGLPSGDSWTFTLNGKNYTSTSDTLNISMVSGIYAYSASGPAGYTVSSAANVTVNNANASVTVTFKQQTSKPNTTDSLLGGIGIGALVGVIAGVFSAMYFTGSGVFRKGKGGNP